MSHIIEKLLCHTRTKLRAITNLRNHISAIQIKIKMFTYINCNIWTGYTGVPIPTNNHMAKPTMLHNDVT